MYAETTTRRMYNNKKYPKKYFYNSVYMHSYVIQLNVYAKNPRQSNFIGLLTTFLFCISHFRFLCQ